MTLRRDEDEDEDRNQDKDKDRNEDKDGREYERDNRYVYEDKRLENDTE